MKVWAYFLTSCWRWILTQCHSVGVSVALLSDLQESVPVLIDICLLFWLATLTVWLRIKQSTCVDTSIDIVLQLLERSQSQSFFSEVSAKVPEPQRTHLYTTGRDIVTKHYRYEMAIEIAVGLQLSKPDQIFKNPALIFGSTRSCICAWSCNLKLLIFYRCFSHIPIRSLDGSVDSVKIDNLSYLHYSLWERKIMLVPALRRLDHCVRVGPAREKSEPAQRKHLWREGSKTRAATVLLLFVEILEHERDSQSAKPMINAIKNIFEHHALAGNLFHFQSVKFFLAWNSTQKIWKMEKTC